MLKDPLIVGPYDAMFTYAEQDAVKFFRRCEFTDDPILASKYRYCSAVNAGYAPFANG